MSEKTDRLIDELRRGAFAAGNEEAPHAEAPHPWAQPGTRMAMAQRELKEEIARLEAQVLSERTRCAEVCRARARLPEAKFMGCVGSIEACAKAIEEGA